MHSEGTCHLISCARQHVPRDNSFLFWFKLESVASLNIENLKILTHSEEMNSFHLLSQMDSFVTEKNRPGDSVSHFLFAIACICIPCMCIFNVKTLSDCCLRREIYLTIF